MAVLKCKMCGGALNIEDGITVCECEYCGTKQTVPNLDDEKKTRLFERANRLRYNCEFDKAETIYESIVAEFPEEAEGYWGIVLCRYGIEYVDDPATAVKIPTCHRVSFDSVMSDDCFEQVMETADAVARGVYREQAKAIEEIRKNIIEVSGKEEPYDIFICYKETDEMGGRTIDSVIAQDVYDALTGKGYRVFFSRITLEDKLGQEYEPYIFAALNSAKVMLAFGTSYDYYNAVWVKNEWSRYLKLMAKDKEKHLIPCYKDIDAYDIPGEFKHLQAQDMGKVGAIQDLIRGIGKIVKPPVKTPTVEVGATIPIATANLNALLDRGFMTLEDGDYAKADGLFEDVLNMDPKCAEAYMGKLMAYYKVRSSDAFARKVFRTLFTNKEQLTFTSEFDVAKVLRDKFIGADELPERYFSRLQEAITLKVETNINLLKEYDESIDYISKFCSLDNDHGLDSQLDDKYYERYMQFADKSCKEKFNISKILNEIVNDAKVKEEARITGITNINNETHFAAVIEDVNKQIENFDGEEISRVEREYQEALSKWEQETKEEEDWYQAECIKAEQEWPDIYKRLEEDWEAKCNIFRDAETRISTELNELKIELANLTGLFKGKRKAELDEKIKNLEKKKNSLTMPSKPEYSSGPFYPNKPVEFAKPVKEIIEGGCNKVKILQDALSKAGIHVKLFEAGDNISFGNYKGTDIIWRVLDADEEKVLVISDKILDAGTYNDDREEITWKMCTLRKWLNNVFYDSAFGNEEKNAVIKSYISNDDNPKYGTTGGADTKDKVFLLSIDEAERYFDSDADRVAYSTEYAESTDLYVDDNGNSWWWLRSSGRYGNHAAGVNRNGSVDARGISVYNVRDGIRPALWIDISKL